MNEEKDKTAISKGETNHLKDDSNNLENDDNISSGNKDSSKECGAISETLPVPIYQYSRKHLMELQQHSEALKRPDCLSRDFDNAAGIWNPERWFMNKRRGDSPIDDTKFKRERPADLDREMLYKRRSSDPKERIREERDDIVLSPQRRSFGTGCHVMQPFVARRPGSPTDARENENHREPNRRIGSGRIVRRDTDRERVDYNRSRDRYEREERDVRFDNRDRYNRERSSKGKREYGRGSKDHGRHRRMEEEDEPEWFSGGPSSQSETIELRGFEPLTEEKYDDGGEADEVYEDKNKVRTRSGNIISLAERNGSLETNASSSPEPPPSHEFETLYSATNHEFDFDEFFKLDQPVPGFLNSAFIGPSQGSDSTTSVSGSRFSRWFQRESPLENHSPCHSRRSSIHDDILNHMLADDKSSIISSPPPENHSLEPIIIISPPHQSEQGKQQQHLLDILHRPTQANGECGNMSTENIGGDEEVMKNKSLAELEAGLKQLVMGNNRVASPPNNNSKDQDMSAFNKLVSALAGKGQLSSLGQVPDGFHGRLPKDKIIHERDLLHELLKNPPPAKSPHAQQAPNITKNVPTEQDILMNLHKHHPPAPPLSPQPNLMQLPPNQVDLLAQILRQQQQQQQNDHLNRLFGQLSPNHSIRGNFAAVAAANNRQEILAQIIKQGQLEQNLLLKQQQPTIVHRPPTPPLQIPQLQPNRQNLKSPNTLSVFDVMQQNILSRQQASSPRIPSPIGFSQQPPILPHAPSPIHPQLSTSPIPTSQPLPVTQTLQVTQNPPIPRVLSPQELINHTKNILYNALVKKQLKEQKETFRKRQELQRARSPNTAATNTTSNQAALVKDASSGNMGSPSKQQNLTPVSAQFTPTSVMKKMHSAKLDDKDFPCKDGKNLGSPEHKIPLQLLKSPDHLMSCDGLHSNLHSPVMTNMNSTNICSTINISINPPPPLITTTAATSNSNNHCLSPRPQPSSPRPLHGQGLMSLPIRTNCPNVMQGRPIVKGGQGGGGDNLLLTPSNKGPSNSPQSFNIPGPMLQPNKLYGGPPTSGQLPRVNHKELNAVDVNKLIEQQRLLQQTAQRQLSTSPMNPSPAATHPAFPVSMTGRAPMHSGIIRPGVATPQAAMLFRNMVHPGAATQLNQLNQHQLNTLNQLAALQQRGFDPRQLQARGLHPMAIQQLLCGPRTNTGTSGSAQQTQNSLGVNVGMNHFGPAPPLSPQNPLKNDNLSPFTASHNFPYHGSNSSHSGQMNTGRQSPVNLSKWFGNELLKQQLPDLPPLPAQKALSVEELERRQQAVGN